MARQRIVSCKEVTVKDCLCETCIFGEQTDAYNCENSDCALFAEVGSRVYKNRTCLEGMEKAIHLKDVK
jgi:hypothetical protein